MGEGYARIGVVMELIVSQVGYCPVYSLLAPVDLVRLYSLNKGLVYFSIKKIFLVNDLLITLLNIRVMN